MCLLQMLFHVAVVRLQLATKKMAYSRNHFYLVLPKQYRTLRPEAKSVGWV